MDYQTLMTNHWKNRTNLDRQLDTIDHPHRKLIIDELKKLAPFETLFEIGCGAGANLINIRKEFPKTTLIGLDINEEAIEAAKEALPDSNFFAGDILHIGSSQKMDIILSDAVLIYVSPLYIERMIETMVRIASKAIVLVELEGGQGETDGENYFENYGELFKPYSKKIIKKKITNWDAEPWKTKGYIYIVHLQ